MGGKDTAEQVLLYKIVFCPDVSWPPVQGGYPVMELSCSLWQTQADLGSSAEEHTSGEGRQNICDSFK